MNDFNFYEEQIVRTTLLLRVWD